MILWPFSNFSNQNIYLMNLQSSGIKNESVLIGITIELNLLI